MRNGSARRLNVVCVAAAAIGRGFMLCEPVVAHPSPITPPGSFPGEYFFAAACKSTGLHNLWSRSWALTQRGPLGSLSASDPASSRLREVTRSMQVVIVFAGGMPAQLPR